MHVPWESCITLHKNAWGYRFENDYKTPREIVHLLIEIVSKGGNLALDIGPQPDGRLAVEAVRILRELGNWLKLNGDAIYGTRICEPYCRGKWSFTGKSGVCFAIRCVSSDEMVENIDWIIPYQGKVKRINSIDMQEIEFEICETGIKLNFESKMPDDTLPFAVVFRMFV